MSGAYFRVGVEKRVAGLAARASLRNAYDALDDTVTVLEEQERYTEALRAGLRDLRDAATRLLAEVNKAGPLQGSDAARDTETALTHTEDLLQ